MVDLISKRNKLWKKFSDSLKFIIFQIFISTVLRNLHSTDVTSHCTEVSPTVLKVSPTVLKLSPTVLKVSLHSTEYPLQY